MRTIQRTGVSTFASRTSPSTGQRLQKSFHLYYADKIELKKNSSPSENKKYATAQTNTTQKMTVKLNNDNGLQTRWTRTPAGNSGLA
jgi:DNA modification methylase